MKNQKFLLSDPALIEASIKTNIHPYVYMTKYALRHFQANADSHTYKNAMIFVSSSAAFCTFPYFGIYSGTKVHNLIFANMIRSCC